MICEDCETTLTVVETARIEVHDVPRKCVDCLDPADLEGVPA